MTTDEPTFLFASRRIEDGIDARCLAAQESGRALAEHHRRALGQRWRMVERELTRRKG